MRRLLGLKAPLETVLLAMAVDRLSVWLWWNTEDGKHGRRPPDSLARRMLAEEPGTDGPAVRTFGTGTEWLAAYEAAITGGEEP